MEREEAIRLLTEAGINDWTIARTTIWGMPGMQGAAQLWILGRWGVDEGSSVELGRGQSLAEAVKMWQGSKPKGRRGT